MFPPRMVAFWFSKKEKKNRSTFPGKKLMRLYSIDQANLVKNRTLAYIILAVILVIAILFWMSSNTQFDIAFYISIGWLVIISLLLWFGNRFLTTRLDNFLPWSRWGNYRFFIHLLLGLFYLLILVNAT